MSKRNNVEQFKEYFETYQENYEEIKGSIGNKLVSVRKSKGLTQQDVADIIGISRAALSYYEKGERTIDVEVLYKLCSLYKISADYLLGMKSTPKTEYDYDEMIEYRSIGFSDEALVGMAGNPEIVDLFNDIVLHKDFTELEYLTHHSRYTRYESMDNEYRSFLTSKLLYSMMADIYEKWYIDNDERINVLSIEEKKKLLSSIEEYKKKHIQYINSLNPFAPLNDFNKLDPDEIWNQMEMLYKKIQQYI